MFSKENFVLVADVTGAVPHYFTMLHTAITPALPLTVSQEVVYGRK